MELVKLVSKFIIFYFFMALVFFTNAFSKDVESDFISLANTKKIYETDMWKSLLHNHSNKNNIIDDNFWLSPNKTLKSELEYTIKGMFVENKDTKDNNNHVLCKFPARAKYIIEELNIDKNLLPKVDCKEFNFYLKKLSAKKVYLSFASENIMSPMSMMGHIFIKIVGFDEKNKTNVNNALSYYANFNKDKESVFEFYFKSLFTGSTGTFNIVSYRQKLIEYNDLSNRNIYDYELNLTENQIEYLIYHIWELKGINFPYNFISNNCGSATVKLLSVANKNFEKAINKFWATPVDIIKILYSKNLISNIEIFPSDPYKIQMFKENFSIKDYKIINNFILNDKYEDIINNTRKNELLFMSDISSGVYITNKKINIERYNQIQDFIYKNFDGIDSIKLKEKTKININSPFSSALSIKFENYKKNNGIGFNFYPVYRTIEDDSSQYFNEFSLNLLNLNAFIDTKENKLILKNFDLINVKSIVPSLYILPSNSFNFKVGYQNEYRQSNNNGNFISEIGLGKSYAYKDIVEPYIILNTGFFKKMYIKLDTGLILKIKNSKFIISHNYFLQNNKKLNYSINASENIFLNDRISFNIFADYYNMKGNDRSYCNIGLGTKFYF